MTTIVVDLRARIIAADTQNTDSAGTAYRCRKIERLSDGSYFLGSGHLLTIAKAKRWAEKGFAERHRPNFGEMFGDCAADFSFSCIVIRPDGSATLIDDEMEPTLIHDDYFAIGSGSAYAFGAMDAGATAEQACKVACKRDLHTSEPVDVEEIHFPKRTRR